MQIIRFFHLNVLRFDKLENGSRMVSVLNVFMSIFKNPDFILYFIQHLTFNILLWYIQINQEICSFSCSHVWMNMISIHTWILHNISDMLVHYGKLFYFAKNNDIWGT
jgi:hypothetical protein